MGCVKSKTRFSSSYVRVRHRDDLKTLKSHTKFDDEKIIELYKAFKEHCPDGRLTPEKFISVYKMLFWKGNAELYCEHVFRTFDTDQNGYIDFKEFILAVYVTSAGTPEEKFRSAFRMYDVDGNGFIDQDEMANVMQAIYGMMGEGAKNPGYWADERAKCIFVQMDENFDGHITEDEFLRGCLQDEELSKMLVV